jgi:hypothetical protein
MTFRLFHTDTHAAIANAALPDVLPFLAAASAGTPEDATC